jgi:hypothetical protein
MNGLLPIIRRVRRPLLPAEIRPHPDLLLQEKESGAETALKSEQPTVVAAKAPDEPKKTDEQNVVDTSSETAPDALGY